MKNISVLIAVLLFAVGGNCQKNEYPEAVKNGLETCMNKMNIPKEDQMVILQTTDYNKADPKLRCLSDCTMTEIGTIQNGEVKIEKVKEIMADYDAEVTEAVIDEVHKKCLAQAQGKGDKCDFANEYGQCTQAVLMKVQ